MNKGLKNVSFGAVTFNFPDEYPLWSEQTLKQMSKIIYTLRKDKFGKWVKNEIDGPLHVGYKVDKTSAWETQYTFDVALHN